MRLKFSEGNINHFSPEIREFLFTCSRVYIDVCIRARACVCVCVCVREYDSKLRRFALIQIQLN